ncbi:caspase Dronc-like [Atheta coriaria]|uniref:caspase Dronc-like n=1 Tax=Dalotia coriaria TaxID=877792 RepID=UPI0031F41123
MSDCIPPDPLKIQVKIATEITAGKRALEDGIHVYKTTAETRGVVKIINIPEVHGLEHRDGSDIDVKNLQSLFEQMGFSVDIHPVTETSHTKEGIETALKNFVDDERLIEADIAMLFIMSHGNRDNNRDFFYSANGEKVLYDDVKFYFSNSRCKSMQGKPKIIFFQVCRGDGKDYGTPNVVKPPVAVHKPQFDGSRPSLPPVRVATYTDMVIAYATSPGYSACRFPNVGSVFINTLCEEFMNQAYVRCVTTMLDNVYRKMSKNLIDYEGRPIVQTGEYTSITFGRCYLNPGVYCDENGVYRNILTKDKLPINHDRTSDSLMDACFKGDFQRVPDLLKSGADVNYRNHEGQSPLHFAANNGNLGICLLLLQKGANINAKSNDGGTPLQSAAYNGNTRICSTFIENGAILSETDNKGNSALHFATLNGHLDTYKVLVDAGADTEQKNLSGETPADFAAIYTKFLDDLRTSNLPPAAKFIKQVRFQNNSQS